MRTLLVCIASALGSAIATLLLIGAWAMVFDTLHRPARQRVSFSEFLAEIDAGHVVEIRIDGRVYTFSRSGSEPGTIITREAIGPAATEADAPALKPSDPALPAPKLVFK